MELNESPRQLSVYDPKTKKWAHVDTCFSTHHLYFAKDHSTLWISQGGPNSGVVGWVDTKKFLETGDSAKSQDGGADAAGNNIRFVVHRLCNMDGTINEVREFNNNVQAIQSCVLAAGGRSCLDQGLENAANCFSQSVQPYYRVTSRVQGPRNTLSYVEVMLF